MPSLAAFHLRATDFQLLQRNKAIKHMMMKDAITYSCWYGGRERKPSVPIWNELYRQSMNAFSWRNGLRRENMLVRRLRRWIWSSRLGAMSMIGREVPVHTCDICRPVKACIYRPHMITFRRSPGGSIRSAWAHCHINVSAVWSKLHTRWITTFIRACSKSGSTVSSSTAA